MTTTDLPGGNEPGGAPRRAVRLQTAPKPSPKAKSAAGFSHAGPPSGIETKLAAAGTDAAKILLTLDTELALRRAGRSVKGTDQIRAMRVLSVALLFTLLIAALGAMSYLQTQLIGHGFKHRAAPGASASPVPGP